MNCHPPPELRNELDSENEFESELQVTRRVSRFERQRLRGIKSFHSLQVVRTIEQVDGLRADLEGIRIRRKYIVHRAEIRVVQDVGAFHQQIQLGALVPSNVERLGQAQVQAVVRRADSGVAAGVPGPSIKRLTQGSVGFRPTQARNTNGEG